MHLDEVMSLLAFATGAGIATHCCNSSFSAGSYFLED